MATRGRPAFKVTPALRKKVEEMVACGMPVTEIGRAIGCVDETVRNHFADELNFGRARRRAEVVELLFKAARGGNVTAMRTLRDMTETYIGDGRVQGAEESAAAPKEPARGYVGKKEQANAEAMNPDVSSPLGAAMARRMAENVH